MDCGLLSRHERTNQWCRFPRSKCACVDHSRYERLDESQEHFYHSEDKDMSNEKEAEMTFFNNDGSFQRIIVEKNLCTGDLCQLLALKNAVPSSAHWSIVEYWMDLGLERVLEEHEYVLAVYKDMKNYTEFANFQYQFRQVFDQYDFFIDIPRFFPKEMLDVDSIERSNMTTEQYVKHLLAQDDPSPVIFSHVWVKDDQKKAWVQAFVLLRDKKLYLSYQLEVIGKFLRMSRSIENKRTAGGYTSLREISEKDVNGLTVFARLADFFVYTTLNAKNHLKAPTEWGICLRPTSQETDEQPLNLRCLACSSEQARNCWLTAMRLAKYGKRIRENYMAFKNKQAESINPKDYDSYTVPNESVRSRVAMDFTGAVGRIVEDPKEANAIAVAEGYSWKRRWRPQCRIPPSSAYLQGLESGVHITQPWFHSGMSRDQATQLVSQHGTVDGVFLVRQSRSHSGSFVLTYKCGSKVIHAQITPILDPVRDAHVFSIDNGVTKFYDLLQLVEFYQLNAGCLPTRLTHYVVQNLSPVKSQGSASSKHSSLSNSF